MKTKENIDVNLRRILSDWYRRDDYSTESAINDIHNQFRSQAIEDHCPECGYATNNGHVRGCQKDKEQKLINHFYEEDNILEHWLTQIALSGETGISLKMSKRLKWVKDQITNG